MPAEQSTQRSPISGPCAWIGSQITANACWTHQISDAEIAIIKQGIDCFKTRDLPWQAADRDNLPLDGLASLIERIRHELEDGTGLFRLRGLPVDDFLIGQLKAFYLSFGDHVGSPVSQSLDGLRMMDIENTGARAKDFGVIDTGGSSEGFKSSRARAFSGAKLRFHTDRCDVVSLMCVRQARRGGHSKIASAVAIHNAMLKRHPDLLEELFTPYPRSRFGEEESDVSVHYMLPVFSQHGGSFTTHYSRTYIEAAQTNPDVPRLREEQSQAIDLLAELANELCFEMTLQPGDIQLLNNHVIYHARDAFVDNTEPGKQRLLCRQWLAMPNSRELPESYRVLFGHTKPGAVRGGIWPPERAYQLPG